MDSTKFLREQLYQKALKEQKEYVEKLKKQPPEEIIKAAYEKTIRDDILMTFENSYYSTKQIKELLKLDCPLSACYDCYDRWVNIDCSLMEMLRDTIGDFANRLGKEQGKMKARKDKSQMLGICSSKHGIWYPTKATC